MFMVPGSNNVVRVNGTAFVTADEAATRGFEQGGRHPRTVVVVAIGEMYFQCAKALMRSGLWSRDNGGDVPKAGEFIREQDETFDADAYDTGYEDYARPKLW
jgi:predicted pyridoxine 5'-phosphate oxidase superfamily flavin-nucleotide-binding protein